MSEANESEIQLFEKVKDFCSIGLFSFVVILCAFTYFWTHQMNTVESSEPSIETVESKHTSVEYKSVNQSSD